MGSGLEPLLGTWGHIVNIKLSKIVIHMLESGRHYGKKEKQIREEIGGTGGQCAVLHRMVRVGLTEATRFEQRLGGGEGSSHAVSGANWSQQRGQLECTAKAVVPGTEASASPGTLLEMHIWGPTPDLNQKWLGPSHLHFNLPCR